MAIDVGPAPTNEHLSSDPSPLRSEGRRPRWWWFGLGGLATAAFVWAIAGSLSLFPLLTQNADEGAYLAQSAALRAGQVVPDAPRHTPMRSCRGSPCCRDGHYVYKYSPVYPAFLAVGHWLFGSERGALGILAAGLVLLVVLFARELGLSRRAALLAGTAFLLAPVFLIQSAAFLPYVGNLAVLLAFAVMLLRGARTRTPWMVMAAGCALGIAFWLRPFDAILFGVPIIVWHLARPPSSLGRRRTAALLAIGRSAGARRLLRLQRDRHRQPLRPSVPVARPGRHDRIRPSAHTEHRGLRRLHRRARLARHAEERAAAHHVVVRQRGARHPGRLRLPVEAAPARPLTAPRHARRVAGRILLLLGFLHVRVPVERWQRARALVLPPDARPPVRRRRPRTRPRTASIRRGERDRGRALLRGGNPGLRRRRVVGTRSRSSASGG